MQQLQVKLGPVSNGEFVPIPHTPTVAEAIRRTHLLADASARRLGISERAVRKRITAGTLDAERTPAGWRIIHDHTSS